MIGVEQTIDAQGKTIRLIDTSEILRVFGRLSDVSDNVSSDAVSDKTEGHLRTSGADKLAIEAARFEAENWGLRMLVEELRESRYRAEQEKALLYEQVRELTNTLKLLESPKVPVHKPKKSGWIYRLFHKDQNGK